MSKNIVHANEYTFDRDVLQATGPVLVDYWAQWCGPCKMIGPLLEEVADEYGSRLKVVKVDVDESQSLAPRYGVRGIPTLMLFRDGDVQDTRVGALSRNDLRNFIDEHL